MRQRSTVMPTRLLVHRMAIRYGPNADGVWYWSCCRADGPALPIERYRCVSASSDLAGPRSDDGRRRASGGADCGGCLGLVSRSSGWVNAQWMSAALEGSWRTNCWPVSGLDQLRRRFEKSREARTALLRRPSSCSESRTAIEARTCGNAWLNRQRRKSRQCRRTADVDPH